MKKINLITYRTGKNPCSHNLFLFIISCIIFSACAKIKNNPGLPSDTTTHSKPDTTNHTIPDTTIYIAGDNGTNPVLWKNGIADTLSPTKGTAVQVIVSGSDVYVSGTYQVIENIASPGVSNGPITGQNVYWKNGVPNDLGEFGVAGGSGYSTAGNNYSITVVGNTVYHSGLIYSVGNDIYIAGSDSAADAVYWKNDTLHVVEPYFGHGSTRPSIMCLFVSGNDVYMGGTFFTAAYWKNEERTVLYSTAAGYDARIWQVTSIFVSGNDVYAAAYREGFVKGVMQKIPGYWKNGVEYDLPLDSAADGYTSSIFVSGSDVYVAGYFATSTPTGQLLTAVYWKNGVETILSSPGIARSIYVVNAHG